MIRSLRQLIEDWDGIAVVSRYDKPTATWIFVALHDDRLGTPTGGTRMSVYPRPEDGLLDAMRLAEGMTHKWAAIEMDVGGGKAVLAQSRELEPQERRELLASYGRLLRAMHGSFSTGQDLGTTPDDMLELAAHAPCVHGSDPRTGRAIDPGPYTARGVLAGMRAALMQALGSTELRSRRVLIQGVGDVGAPLAQLCATEGAVVLVSDLDRERAARIAAAVHGEVRAADAVYSTPCDIYAPCATGATLSGETIPQLACRIVAGSANNQLARPEAADELHQRGILYAPDYMTNAGGALAFGLMARGQTDEDRIGERIDGLQHLLARIFEEAARRQESPAHAARRHVDRVLTAAQSDGDPDASDSHSA